MTVVAEEQTIYPPPPGSVERQRVAALLEALAGPEPLLRGSCGTVRLPPELYALLLNVVEALDQGLAVSLTPHRLQVSTQEAADILGVSRTSVVRWIEEGRLGCEQLGRHRRLMLSEVMGFRQNRRRD